MPSRLHHLARLPQHLLDLSGIPTHPRTSAGIAAGAVIAAAATYFYLRSRRPTPAELERLRRDRLFAIGRLTDGSLVDARTLTGDESNDPAPEVLLYRYRIGGVTYDCAQDVSILPDRTSGYRIDQPVQVRYDPRNPGNSIVVSEDWSGLRMKPQRYLPFVTPTATSE